MQISILPTEIQEKLFCVGIFFAKAKRFELPGLVLEIKNVVIVVVFIF